MKLKLIITIIISAVFAGLIGYAVIATNRLNDQKTEIANLQDEAKLTNQNYKKLAEAFTEISKQKTYSISLAPTVNNKVSTTFGNSKNITFQYYFTMDGNTMEIKPDSTKTLKSNS